MAAPKAVCRPNVWISVFVAVDFDLCCFTLSGQQLGTPGSSTLWSIGHVLHLAEGPELLPTHRHRHGHSAMWHKHCQIASFLKLRFPWDTAANGYPLSASQSRSLTHFSTRLSRLFF